MAHFVHFISLIVELERAFKNALHSVSACYFTFLRILRVFDLLILVFLPVFVMIFNSFCSYMFERTTD